MKWFEVSYDAENITISRRKLLVLKSVKMIPWARIIRICFLAGDQIRFDEVYIFTDERPESYVIPLDAYDGLQLWNEIIKRGLFDAELAIKAASASSDELLCWPPEKE
ncbi:hypothetical protein E4H12_15995 [Candidatus Thorarchaeota archaeon]|nr:hypothetical protein [Candidatus Thorarchaeota archaeon]TFG93994.1 MAG: hypothetical protein E4H12_15995 [Candidatus Thorarchaeota archaeon]